MSASPIELIIGSSISIRDHFNSFHLGGIWSQFLEKVYAYSAESNEMQSLHI